MPPTVWDEKSIKALCRKWQRRMKIRDWDITVLLVGDKDPELTTEYCGNCDANTLEKTATIKIAHAGMHDVEGTLVHELEHVLLQPFGDDDTDEKQCALNVLARVLISAWKGR